jgi:hypothetical protein
LVVLRAHLRAGLTVAQSGLTTADLKERSSVVRWADQMAEYLADKMAAPKD